LVKLQYQPVNISSSAWQFYRNVH